MQLHNVQHLGNFNFFFLIFKELMKTENELRAQTFYLVCFLYVYNISNML